jgi:hypothetical protein
MHLFDMISGDEPPNEALHRTAKCVRVLPWGFSFIRQLMAVGELGRSL